MILSVCDNPTVLEIMRYVKIALTVIRIVVPLALIISLMVGYTSAVKEKDDDLLSKANKSAIVKGIAALLIFLIPTFVNVIANTITSDQSYIACFKSATPEGINNSYKKMAEQYIETAKSSLNRADYVKAKTFIESKITNASDKKSLLNKLATVDTYIKIKEDIDSLKKSFNQKLYEDVEKRIKKVTDSAVKKKLEQMYKEIVKPGQTGTPEGVRRKAKTMYYMVHTPSFVNNGMPMVLYLHGDNGARSDGSSPFLSQAKKHFGKEIPFILITPAGGMWAETAGRLEELKGILDEECNRYNCNKQRISVAGHSRGAIGTWGIVSKYPGYFYAAIPVSCGATRGFSSKNCTKTKIRAYGGNVGPYEPSYSSRMQSIVRQIKGYGGDATFTLLSGAGHGDTPGKAFTQENMLWMVN